jgi:hypothetical protein
MKSRLWALGVLTAALAAAAPALAAPATVNLRVEGATGTIFDGTVTTNGHAIEQDKAGPQPCDGTNNGASAVPGPTVTSTLDDAAAWDGSWSNSLKDFEVTRIGPDANTASKFWGLVLNFKQLQVGGCQQQVKTGDQVLFAYDLFSMKHILELTGPSHATSGRKFKVKVVDGQNGQPVAGAKVGVAKTNSQGIASTSFRGHGRAVLKAQAPDSVRSNALIVQVRKAKKG